MNLWNSGGNWKFFSCVSGKMCLFSPGSVYFELRETKPNVQIVPFLDIKETQSNSPAYKTPDMKHWMAAGRQGMQANEFIFSSSACHFSPSSQNVAPDQSSGQRGALVPCLPPSCWNPRWRILCLGAEAASQHWQMCIVLTVLGVGRHFSCI